METKQCNKCGQVKPIDSFRKRKNRNGIVYWYGRKCKDCCHEEHEEYFKNKMSNPEYANKRRQDNKKAVIKYYSVYQNRIKKKNREKANYYRDNHNIRKCVICNKEYNVLENGTVSYCSNECKKQAIKIINANYKHKTRLRKWATVYQYINPIKVFNRDKWHCKLCGVSTPKSMRGTIALNAPELDHIIPLSKGGSHTYTNVQCLCRSCNNIKSDKLIGQLKLCI